jgi:hypothetical protein
MLVATLIAALGFGAVAVGTRRYGLRLGGTIVVGVLGVYTLKNFSTLPIFLVSATLAYLALGYAKRNTLIYGRDEFVVAILAGSLLPATIYLGAVLLPGGVQVELYRSVFVGSLLSGIAAFNLHQVRAGYRTKDIAAGAGLYVGLLALGALLVGPSTRFLGAHTPLVLFASTSDIAVLRGAVVAGFVDPAFVGRPFIIGVFVLTLGLSEYVRSSHGVHIGTVALGLLAIYTVSTWHLLAIFLITWALVFATLSAVHRTLILYGRALLSTGAAIGVVLAVPLALLLDVSAGLSTLFTGVLGGLMGYYVHRTSPRERRQQLPLAVAVFVALLLVVRAVAVPGPDGFPRTFGVAHVVVGAAIVAAGVGIARGYRIGQPADEVVLAESVLNREDD